MGYLDGSSITVDAILTKQGRKMLAQGQGLNITKFALGDTGVDYKYIIQIIQRDHLFMVKP